MSGVEVTLVVPCQGRRVLVVPRCTIKCKPHCTVCTMHERRCHDRGSTMFLPRAYPAWLTQLLHVLSDHPRLFLATAQILLPITSLVFLVASARVKDVLGWGAQIPPDRSMLQLAHDLESSRREKLLSCESHRGHHLLGTEHYRCHLPSQCYPTTRQASIAHTLKV
jgi:hypothetical protein